MMSKALGGSHIFLLFSTQNYRNPLFCCSFHILFDLCGAFFTCRLTLTFLSTLLFSMRFYCLLIPEQIVLSHSFCCKTKDLISRFELQIVLQLDTLDWPPRVSSWFQQLLFILVIFHKLFIHLSAHYRHIQIARIDTIYSGILNNEQGSSWCCCKIQSR